MRELIDKIAYVDGTLPRAELQEIIDNKEEAIPELLRVLEEVLAHPESHADRHMYVAHIYAFHLLTQFKVHDTLHLFIDFMRLEEDMSYALLDDFITDSGDRMFVSLYREGDFDLIKSFITDERIDPFARASVVNGLKGLVLNGTLKRAEVMSYFGKLLRDDSLHESVYSSIVVACTSLYPEEVMEDIRVAYEREKVESGVIGLDEVEEALARSKEEVIEESILRRSVKPIDDTIAEVEKWAIFRETDSLNIEKKDKRIFKPTFGNKTYFKEVTVGRNDPCPCGSGKKYKKCCMG